MAVCFDPLGDVPQAAAGQLELGHEPEAINLPLLSTSKQNRINIWRTEVAALTLPPPPSSPSSAASATSSQHGRSPLTPLSSTTTMTLSSSSSTETSRLSRGRRLLNRLLGRSKKVPEEPIRTDMYRGMMPPEEDLTADALALVAGEANDNALQEKLERMERAARLLERAERATTLPPA